jgi:hypothetical protein
MWLTGRLSPDFKTIADFRKDNAEAKQEPRVASSAEAQNGDSMR